MPPRPLLSAALAPRETLAIQKAALKLWGGAPVDSSVPVLHFDAPLLSFDMVSVDWWGSECVSYRVIHITVALRR